MSTDRRIALDVAVPNFNPGGVSTGGSGTQQRQEADAGARERFEQAMQASSQQVPAPAQVPGTPLSLFSTPVAKPDPAFTSRVGDSVERLMVGDGSSGNKQVRMELKDDVLPGVSVTVQELEGRLHVDFFCSVEASRLRLNEAAPAQAHELAARLAREVLVAVQTDDDEDPCRVEALAAP